MFERKNVHFLKCSNFKIVKQKCSFQKNHVLTINSSISRNIRYFKTSDIEKESQKKKQKKENENEKRTFNWAVSVRPMDTRHQREEPSLPLKAGIRHSPVNPR
jgi:hypothetical protein